MLAIYIDADASPVLSLHNYTVGFQELTFISDYYYYLFNAYYDVPLPV